jgi:hypothetical protein
MLAAWLMLQNRQIVVNVVLEWFRSWIITGAQLAAHLLNCIGHGPHVTH